MYCNLCWNKQNNLIYVVANNEMVKKYDYNKNKWIDLDDIKPEKYCVVIDVWMDNKNENILNRLDLMHDDDNNKNCSLIIYGVDLRDFKSSWKWNKLYQYQPFDGTDYNLGSIIT